MRRLAEFSRLLVFDKRGTGMSDPVTDVPDLETRMDDIRAVMDAAGSERVVVFGLGDAAPVIPIGVQQVMEYLNGQGLRLYGLEVSYFKGTVECFVPRVVVTPHPVEKVSPPANRPKQWDEASIVEALAAQHGEQVAGVARRIFEWARERNLRLWFGKGAIQGSFAPGLDDDSGYLFPFTLWTTGVIHISFGNMVGFPEKPFDQEHKRRELQLGYRNCPTYRFPTPASERSRTSRS
jgi:hypothetical protein